MLRVLIASLTLIIFCRCSASIPVKKEPKKAPPPVEKEYRTAERLAKSGDAKKAMPKLKQFAQANPESDLTGEAYFLMGQMHLNSQQLPEALTDFLAIVNMSVSSPYEIEATLKAARIQLKLSQPAEADKTLEKSVRFKSPTTDQSIELLRLRFETASALKNNFLALEMAVALAQKAPTQVERDKFKTIALESLDSRFKEDDYRQIGSDSKYSIVRPLAKFRYGLLIADRRQYLAARDQFAEVVSLAPGTELAERSQVLIAQIDARNRVEAHTVGVVLPLSGKQAAIGYKALRAIQLGLGIYGTHGKPSGLRLAIVDSEGNPDTARHAVERLVQEDNVIAIIGGLLSKTTGTEAAKAQELSVPAIMLSQKATATQAGDYVFRNSLTSQMQVHYLVELAMVKHRLKNFAILYPNDAYGVEYANLFWDEVRARGGEIRGAQPYDPQETDFRGYVQRLVGTFYLEDRADEYRLYAKAWVEKNPKRGGQHAAPAPEELLPPIVDFDAIFIPDSAKAVGQIAPMLAYNNVTGVRLLGTNLWNSAGLISRGQKFVEGALFVDSFLATDPEYVNSDFFRNFKATFDEEPGLTEVQAYDSATVLRQLIAGGESTRSGLQARLAKLDNFPAVLGTVSVNSDREFRRPLSALTVKDGKITELDSTRR